MASIEKKLLFDQYGRWLWILRQLPSHATHWLAGIRLPPHERMWLRLYFGDTKENNVVASRGTSKSFTLVSAAATLYGFLYKNVATLSLSASGFRGGKELFRDADRLIQGQLRSQQLPGKYLRKSISGKNILARDPSIWTILTRSHSRHSTAPTNNPEDLRGLRANRVLVDERNTFPGATVQKIIRPMLNVGQDFVQTAKGGDGNRIFQISTIDYSERDWVAELKVAEDLQRREFAASKALKNGDFDEYDRLLTDNDGQLREASFSYSRVDYTDLIIPERIKTLDGETTYRVHYPADIGVSTKDIVRYDEHDKQKYVYTYPVDKKGLEQPLKDGTVDEDTWMAEQRNVLIAASGNVFGYDLLSKVAERPLSVHKELGRKSKSEDTEYFIPVLYTCADPCVLGIDVARESDETSFVVFRLGPIAEHEFIPFEERTDSKGRSIVGRTEWSHICWAESHRKMTSHEAAGKVRELYERYNIVTSIGVPGIGMDKRGGGSAVRDDLGNPKPDIINGVVDSSFVWEDVVKIYDPKDVGGYSHYAAMDESDKYWGGLRLIASTNQDNVEWTHGLRAMMQKSLLYLAYWMPPSLWARQKGLTNPNGEPDRLNPEYIRWEVGYTGIRRLRTQLQRIQTKVSEQGVVRYTMPGDRGKEDGKKDLWAASIYGYSLVREHLVSKTKTPTEPPTAVPLMVNLTSGLFQRAGFGAQRQRI